MQNIQTRLDDLREVQARLAAAGRADNVIFTGAEVANLAERLEDAIVDIGDAVEQAQGDAEEVLLLLSSANAFAENIKADLK
jgi:hypothetical protein